MRNKIINSLNIEGDRIIWILVVVISVFSFLPVYSAASNLSMNTLSYLIKHMIHVSIGFAIIYFVHKIKFEYFGGLSKLALPIVVVLLLVTLLQGKTIGGANASRWIRVAGFSFQTSALAGVVVMAYCAKYLSKIHNREVSFKETIVPFLLPIFLVCGLIFPANLSTAAMIFVMVLGLMFVGHYPIKYMLYIISTGIVFLALFFLTISAFPNIMPNRVDTWKNRITNFTSKDGQGKDNYQVNKSKTAIALGRGVFGAGPGKSTQKAFLPQSSSDFIFAIVVEEYGVVIGGFLIILAYLFLLLRITIVATNAKDVFGKLLVIAVGIPIIFQAFINIGVAVNLLPVTGQTLPLISSGGSSIWMTCLALGVILSVSKNKQLQ